MTAVRNIAPLILAPALILAPLSASARSHHDQARVVNVKPQYQMVSYTVPVEQCRLEQVPVRDYNRNYRGRSHTAPIVGAIIGGAVGNAVMHGKTRKRVGTAVGAVLGASIGADVSRNNAHRHARRVSYRDQEVCHTVDEVREERQITGYRVKYRYGGETYVTMMDRDPGRYLRVRVEVTPV